VVAAKNLSRRGLLRFGSSLPSNDKAKGGAVEAMKGNQTTAAILRADAPKLRL
jgi:hypothetical protein